MGIKIHFFRIDRHLGVFIGLLVASTSLLLPIPADAGFSGGVRDRFPDVVGDVEIERLGDDAFGRRFDDLSGESLGRCELHLVVDDPSAGVEGIFCPNSGRQAD